MTSREPIVVPVVVHAVPNAETSDLQRLVEPAAFDAWNRRGQQVAPEHVLLQLIRDSQVASHLTSQGISVVGLAERIMRSVEILPVASRHGSNPQVQSDDFLKMLQSATHRVLRQGRRTVTKFDILDALLDESLELPVTRVIVELALGGSLESLRGVSGRSCALCGKLAAPGSATTIPGHGPLCLACTSALGRQDPGNL
jgi:hypothetical protein